MVNQHNTRCTERHTHCRKLHQKRATQKITKLEGSTILGRTRQHTVSRPSAECRRGSRDGLRNVHQVEGAGCAEAGGSGDAGGASLEEEE